MNVDVEALTSVFERYPGIEAVYLFGSHAAGTAKPDSDLDLAIVPKDASLREHRLEILTDLTRLGIDCVDLVFLDTHDLVLQ